MLPPIVTGGIALAILVTFAIALGTGIPAIKEFKKGTKVSDNPLKGEIISFSVFCALCMCLTCVLKMSL